MSVSLRTAPRRRASRPDALLVGLLAAALALMAFMAATARAEARERVAIETGFQPGTLVVSQSQKRLYFVEAPGRAIRYRVAVGKPGKQWRGVARVDGKYIAPAWSPPAEVKRDNPSLPEVIAGGAPNNPMGQAALTLDRGEYAIHGTSASMRSSIGRAASYGCIRMLNEDILDLYARVDVGALVVVTP